MKKKEDVKNGKTHKLKFSVVVILIISCFFLYLGAKYTVDSIIEISEIIGIGTEIISATVVALGTSLPEIMASIMLVRKKQLDTAVGTLLGSNIFNAFVVLGISSMFGTLLIPTNMIMIGIPFLVIATLLYFFITLDREITKWEGLILVIFYFIYLGKIISLF